MEKIKKYKDIIGGVEIQHDVNIEGIRSYTFSELLSNLKNKVRVLTELKHTDHPRKDWKSGQLTGEIAVIEDTIFNKIQDMTDRHIKQETWILSMYENVIKRLSEVDETYRKGIHIDPYLKEGEKYEK